MDTIVSGYISDFLDFLEAAKEAVGMAEEKQRDANRRISDLEHFIELKRCTAPERMIVYKRLQEARLARRRAKETIENCTSIVEWYSDNQKAIHALQEVLGETRKVESIHEKTVYMFRTDVLKDICGGSDRISHIEIPKPKEPD